MSVQSQPVSAFVGCFGLKGVAGALQCSPDALFAMFSEHYLYCDESGGQDHGFIVVAGYLSTLDRWHQFTAEWNRHLATFNLPYFHMKEFVHFKGPFSSWTNDEPRRARFLSRAVEIIECNVLRGFAELVEYESFERVNQLYYLDVAAGVPYSLAARGCAARAFMYLQNRSELHYVFEDGAKGKGELLRLMERDGHPSPIFRPSRDRKTKDGGTTRGVIPLQAADFAAYELRRAHQDDPHEIWPLDRYRKSLQALSRIPSSREDWGRYREVDLVELCRNLSVPLRSEQSVFTEVDVKNVFSNSSGAKLP